MLVNIILYLILHTATIISYLVNTVNILTTIPSLLATHTTYNTPLYIQFANGGPVVDDDIVAMDARDLPVCSSCPFTDCVDATRHFRSLRDAVVVVNARLARQLGSCRSPFQRNNATAAAANANAAACTS